MKLRNKKTGEVFNFTIKSKQENTESYLLLNTGSGGWEDGLGYATIAELNEEWEDYKPAEPLIKDEKVRKAVRAWAEANEYSLVKVGYDMVSEPNYGNVQIHFEFLNVVDEDFGIHTIAELCGEEEE